MNIWQDMPLLYESNEKIEILKQKYCEKILYYNRRKSISSGWQIIPIVNGHCVHLYICVSLKMRREEINKVLIDMCG